MTAIPSYPPTIVVRHRKENLKKCSLSGLEKRFDFLFFSYPLKEVPPFSDYILLSVEAEEELSPVDSFKGLLILDATWRYAQMMEKSLHLPTSIVKRSLPKTLKTAYPRRQQDCSAPQQGLASIEAIFAAYVLLGRDPYGLLDHYHWKNAFLQVNQDFCFFQQFCTIA